MLFYINMLLQKSSSIMAVFWEKKNGYSQTMLSQHFGLVLWYMNQCKLFNTKSFLYIYMKEMIFKYIL